MGALAPGYGMISGAAATATVAAAVAPPLPVLTAAPTWSELMASDLTAWDRSLLRTPTDLHQFPMWNEPLRRLGLTPRYLVWGTAGRHQSYVCVLTAGPQWARVGLVFRGPTSLHSHEPLPRAALEELMEWAYWERYCFLRFTSTDERTLNQLATLPYALPEDAFPFFQDYSVISPDYRVEQSADEQQTLASLDREVRRKVRRAEESGCEFRAHNAIADLAAVWPMFVECARRKQFKLERPRSFYQDLMRRAAACDAVRLYSVKQSQQTVGSALVLRDGSTAHCLLAAFGPEHRYTAAFLHWRAMRDMYAQGAHTYNLGPGPGDLARFKRQFTRNTAAPPRPVTVVLNEDQFRLWSKLLLPLASKMRPWLRAAACLSYQMTWRRRQSWL